MHLICLSEWYEQTQLRGISSLEILYNMWYLYNIGWPWGGYKNISPEMLIILPESKTRVILLALRAIYSCIPRKRVIEYYYHYMYSYRALCVILLSYDHGRLSAAILSVYKQAEKSACQVRACLKWSSTGTQILPTNRRHKSMLNDWSQKARAIIILLPSLSQSAWNTRHQKHYMDNNTLYCCELLWI